MRKLFSLILPALRVSLFMIALLISVNASAQTWGARVLIGLPSAVGTAGAVGSYASSRVVNGNPAIAYYDESADNLVYVRATDASGATWGTPVIIDFNGKVGSTLSLALVAGNPAIAYRDDSNLDLKYVRALDVNGSTWSVPISIDVAGNVGNYPSLTEVAGNPAISYFSNTDFAIKYIRASNISGTVWNTPVVIETAMNTSFQFSTLLVVNGNPAISFAPVSGSKLAIRYRRSTNSTGSDWSAPVTVHVDAGVDFIQPAMQIINGNPAIAYYDQTNQDLKYVRASDGSGAAWGTPITVDATGIVGSNTSLQIVNGTPAISYYDNTNQDLKYVRSADGTGAAWNTPITVDATGIVANTYTSMQVVNGNPAIAYYNATNADLKFIRAGDASGLGWATPAITFDVPGQTATTGTYNSTQLVNGNPAMSYYNSQNGNLVFVRATNTQGTAWGSPVTVANNMFQSTTSLYVVNGNPAISYYGAGNDLFYVRATDANGTTWGTPIALHSALAAGEYSSLSVINGNPAISFYNATGTDLNFIRANDANGSTWPATSVSAVVNAGIVGQHTSLATVNGFPAISYYNGTLGDLLYVRAADANGTAWGAPITVDGLGGTFTSLKVVNGNPAISYYETGSFDLKYAYANDASGATWATPLIVDATGSVGQSTSLAVINGSPAIAYSTATTGSIKYVVGNAAGTSWGTPVTVDNTTTANILGVGLIANGTGAGIGYYSQSEGLPAYVMTCNNPTVPSLSATATSICEGVGTTVTLSIATGTLNAATNWFWYSGGCGGISIGSGTSVVVSPTVTTTYYARGEGGCSASGTCASITINVLAAPLAFPITGNTTVCPGTINTYTVGAVTGATSYTWTLPGGWTGTSTTNSITTNAGSSSGNISVSANSPCGTYPSQPLAVTVSSAPSQPGAITGVSNVCIGSSYTYSVAPVSGATSYTWTLPLGWTGTSTIVSISATAANQSGNISVTANNGSCSSTPQTLAVSAFSIPAPAQPGVISGNAAMCAGSSNSYSVGSVVNATSYSWTLPTGWTGTPVANSITATAGTVGGTISITANNACGISPPRTLAVTINPVPAQPGAITGIASPCSRVDNNYSIEAVIGATSYTWNLPSAWTGTSTTNSLTATASATAGNITVTASNACGTSTAQTLAVTPITLPVQPGVITGSATVCSGSSNTYSITTIAGATSYIWTLPSGWTGTSTTTSITTTASATSGNVSVTANNICGASTAQTLAVTVTGSIAQPGAITGNTAICSGSSNTYTIAAVVGASSYTWTLPGGWAGTSTTTSITTTAGTTSGNISVSANNASCGSSAPQTLGVTVISIPVQPSSVTGNAIVCLGSSNTYTIASVSGATSYTWTLPSGWTGTSTTTSITATASSTSGNVSVTANNTCGSSTTQTLAVTVNNIPAQPGTITGNTTACSGSSNTYTVAAVSGATSYTWTLPGGWTGTSTTASIITTAGATSGNVSVMASNTCGASSAQALAITVTGAIAQPGAITGNTAICSGSSNTYSIAAVNGATSYIWTLPGGWTGSSTTTSITTTASTTSGNVSVAANNASCGSSAAQTLGVTVNSIPVQPSTVTGNTSVCSGSSNTYTIAAVSGATSYTWTLPSGWTGTSTTASITTTASTASGNISVTANNSCGSSTAQVLSVSVGIPAQPGTISGNVSFCSGSSNTYTIAVVPGATSYTWTLPSGWTGTSTTESITATASTTSGSISVTADNTCGSSAAQTLAVTVNNIPAQPGTITGNAILCSGSSNTYTIAAVGGATSYAWILPSGWLGTSTAVSITTIASATGGNVSVTANNICGASIVRTMAVTVNGTPAQPTISVSTTNPEAPVLTASTGGATDFQWFKNGVAISGATANTHTVASEGSYTVQLTVNGCTSAVSSPQVMIITGDGSFKLLESNFYLYPNPTSSLLNVSLRQFNAGEEVGITVSDLLGRIMENTKGIGGTVKEINVGSFPSGKYIVFLRQAKQKVTGQFIKSN
jgi:PKD-like domain/Secretion system C-terminal sorting domain/Ig-like domain CHU_C associated